MTQPHEKTDRNREMVRLHVEEGRTLTEIGDVFGVSRERVRQIVRREGVPQEITREVMSVAMMDRVPHRCPVCGKERMVTPSTARERTYCSPRCMGEARRRYAVEGLLPWLRQLAASVGRTPTAADLNAADGPSARLYQYRFGSLARAQELAGLEPNAIGRPANRTNGNEAAS